MSCPPSIRVVLLRYTTHARIGRWLSIIFGYLSSLRGNIAGIARAPSETQLALKATYRLDSDLGTIVIHLYVSSYIPCNSIFISLMISFQYFTGKFVSFYNIYLPWGNICSRILATANYYVFNLYLRILYRDIIHFFMSLCYIRSRYCAILHIYHVLYLSICLVIHMPLYFT